MSDTFSTNGQPIPENKEGQPLDSDTAEDPEFKKAMDEAYLRELDAYMWGDPSEHDEWGTGD